MNEKILRGPNNNGEICLTKEGVDRSAFVEQMIGSAKRIGGLQNVHSDRFVNSLCDIGGGNRVFCRVFSVAIGGAEGLSATDPATSQQNTLAVGPVVPSGTAGPT